MVSASLLFPACGIPIDDGRSTRVTTKMETAITHPYYPRHLQRMRAWRNDRKELLKVNDVLRETCATACFSTKYKVAKIEWKRNGARLSEIQFAPRRATCKCDIRSGISPQQN